MPLTIQLRQTPQPVDNAAALFVHGDSAETWLRVAADHGLATARLRFLPIPRGSDAKIHGALILPDNPDDLNTPVFVASADATPYHCRADRLFLPADAVLQPPIGDAELTTLLPTDASRVLVWHPGLGLVGFDREHVLTTADLLRTPRVTVADCSATQRARNPQDPNFDADPEAASGRIPEGTPDVDSVLNSGGDDIGTHSDSIDDAPRSPDEKSAASLRDAMAQIRNSVAQAIHGITSKLPASANGSRLLRRLHDWARHQAGNSGQSPFRAGSPSSELSAKRENQIRRLLHMLEHDPDRGLRYAIPSSPSADIGGRGTLPPGSSLSEHSSDFNLNDLNNMRGGPADVWDLPWEYQVRLISQYRRLAERELHFGRVRRAAYIYGCLLGDLPSAARALETGGFHHDAAMVYLEHLQQPLKAADCLRAGGFPEEALQIYRNHDRWLEAGDLLLELRRHDDARDAFRQQIQACEQRLDFRGAADVAVSRLNDPDLATRLLTAGWMRNSHAEECLRGLLRLQADHGRHDAAISIMDQLTGRSVIAADQLEEAARVISESAVSYPDDAVREAARRHTWRLAAELVKRNPDSEPHVAMAAIRQLAPSDRLLKSDTHRFQAEKQAAVQEQKRKTQQTAGRAAPIINCVDRYVAMPALPRRPEVSWYQVTGNGRYVFHYGRGNIDMLDIVVRHRLTAQQVPSGLKAATDRLDLHPREIGDGMPLTLRLATDTWDTVWLHRFRGPGQWCVDPVNRRAIADAGFARSIQPDIRFVLDVAPAAAGSVYVLADSEEQGLRLVVIGPDGLARSTIPLPEIERQLAESRDDDPRSPIVLTQLFVHDRGVSIVIGRFLFLCDGQQSHVVHEFFDRPTHVQPSPPATVPRLAFTVKDGVTVIWPTSEASCHISSDSEYPTAGFTTNGQLIIGSRETGVLTGYRLHNGAATMTGRVEADRGASPQCIVPGPHPGQFIVIDDAGTMYLYQCPDG